MIRTIITPENTDLHLSIPASYIGKQVEVLLYTTEEVNIEKATGLKNTAALRGKLHLSNEQSADFHHYLNENRSEWNRAS